MGENTQSKFDLELEKIGITLNERQKQQFDKYYEMLVEWNKVMNLTGITEYDEVNLKHFTDSLTIARTQEMQKVQRSLRNIEGVTQVYRAKHEEKRDAAFAK